jgi:hypothetical protein
MGDDGRAATRMGSVNDVSLRDRVERRSVRHDRTTGRKKARAARSLPARR